MITNPVSTIHQPPLGSLSAQPPVSATPEAEPVRNKVPEDSPVPGAHSRPRLRRSTGLENGSATPQTEPSVQTPPVGGRRQVSQEMLEKAGNIHNREVLADALDEVRKVVEEDPEADVAALLEAKRFSVHSLSTYGRDYEFKPGEQISVAWFLRENLQHVPQNLEQLSNLIDVSRSRLNEQPLQGDYRGALAVLGTELRTQLHNLAAAEKVGALSGNDLFKVFHEKQGASIQGKSAAEVLEMMLESPEVEALGQRLKAGLPDAPASASSVELALAAMILALDPQAGSKRGVVAGYDLHQPANAGVHPSVVVTRFTQHLVDQGSVPAEMAPAAARLLLAGAAPVFLVEGMPDNLRVESMTWAKLQTVVETDEFWAPGSATSNSFTKFMARADFSPVSDAEAIVHAKAQSHALIEWGVAQGRISRKADDGYTQAEVAGLRDAFNAQLTALRNAQEQLSATLPTRKEMALEELKKTYGADGPFDERNTRITNIDASESDEHSLLEIYMAGKMDRIPEGPRFDFRIGKQFHRVKPLPDIKQQFNSQFDSYLRNVKEGVTTTVTHQLSQLPLDDRQTIASGKVEFFSLRKSSAAQAEGEESKAQAQAAKGRYGLLMRVESKIDKNGSDRDDKNLRYVYYEVFPLQGVIRRRDDLPRYLPNPAPRVAGADTYAERQAKGVSMWVDYEAYESGSAPQLEKFSGGLLTERVRGPFLPEATDGQEVSASTVTNPRFSTIGRVIADHLFHDHETMKAGARGVTHVEDEEADIKAGHAFVTGLIPFKNAIENAVKGNTGAAIVDFALDIFGFVVPVSKGIGAAAGQLIKGAGKFGARAFRASDAVARGVFSGLNPVDGLGGAALGLAKGGKTLLQKSYKELKALLQAPDFSLASVLKTADVALHERYAVNKTKLAGLSPDSQGVYRAADDQLYIRSVDESGEETVFQVREVTNNQGVVQARVIDPQTNRQSEYLLQKNGTDQWQRLGLRGGESGPSLSNQGAGKRPHGDSAAGSTSGGSSAPKRPKVREIFPGEKADLDPPVKGANVFYHYTGKDNSSSIAVDWTLQPSSHELAGQKLPDGKGRHYFTDLAPGDKPTKEISETIFGKRPHGNWKGKMTHYYEVNTSGLELKRSPNNPHIFYVDTHYSIPLKYRNGNGDLVNRMIKHGRVPA